MSDQQQPPPYNKTADDGKIFKTLENVNGEGLPTRSAEPEPAQPKSLGKNENDHLDQKIRSIERSSPPKRAEKNAESEQVIVNKEPEKNTSAGNVSEAEKVSEPEKANSTEKAPEPEKAKSSEKSSEPEKAKSAEKPSEPEKAKSTEKPSSEPEKATSTEKAPEPEKAKSTEKPSSEPEKAKSTEKPSSEPEKAKSTEKPSAEPEKATSTEKASSEPEKAESTEKPSSEPEKVESKPKSEPKVIHLVVEATKAAEPKKKSAAAADPPLTPHSLDKIKPKITFYKWKRADHFYDVLYDTDPDKAIVHLQQNGYFDCTKLTILVHGFCSDIHATWMQSVKQKLTAVAIKNDVGNNVAMVGFSHVANSYSLYYKQAAHNVKTVADWLAPYIRKIKQAEPKVAMHGIGHNLGAHVLGMASRQSDRCLDRISGLDPAGPCFVTVLTDYMLKEDDAKYVDVIHTNDLLSEPSAAEPLHLGTLTPMGTVDFYPNFGYNQPGEKYGHNYRSAELFDWSIDNPEKFRTNLALKDRPDHYTPVTSYKKCEYEQEMGYHADQWAPPPQNAESCYFIKTNAKEPWAPAD